MAISEETIVEVLRLLPNHSTVEALREADTLRDVTLADIRAALCILEERGQARAGELFGRGMPPRIAA